MRLPRWLDLVVNVFGAPVLLSALAFHDLAYNGAGPVSWLLGLLTIWPLVARRRAPVVTFALCLVGLLGLYVTSSPPFAGFALLSALYTVAAHRPMRHALLAGGALELLVVLEAVQQSPAQSVDDTIVVLSASAIAALFLGTTMRTQRRLVASLEDRASRLEREREREAVLAAAAERSKIAREMHDIVAHGLSVVITLSEGAAARVDGDPATARRTMEQVASTGRQSLGEMRRLLGVLRADDEASRAPQPGLAELDALIDDVRATGLTVDLEHDGALSHLEPTMQTALFRAVQEGLTNVLKHAEGARRASVRIERDEHVVRFSVQDDGRARAGRRPPGNGLIGMAERAAIFGGEIRTTADSGGWTLLGEFEAVSATHGVGADR
jgi:signal transduction histidine kinase